MPTAARVAQDPAVRPDPGDQSSSLGAGKPQVHDRGTREGVIDELLASRTAEDGEHGEQRTIFLLFFVDRHHRIQASIIGPAGESGL